MYVCTFICIVGLVIKKVDTTNKQNVISWYLLKLMYNSPLNSTHTYSEQTKHNVFVSVAI
jgi:hypothetical protein